MTNTISLSVVDVDEQGDKTFVELEGKASSFMPDFIVTNRARLKAIRVVGGENILRGAVEEVVDGDLSRATNIRDFDRNQQATGISEVFIVVGIDTGEDDGLFR